MLQLDSIEMKKIEPVRVNGIKKDDFAKQRHNTYRQMSKTLSFISFYLGLRLENLKICFKLDKKLAKTRFLFLNLIPIFIGFSKGK